VSGYVDTAAATASPREKLATGALAGLALLTAINLLNYLDRFIVAGIVPDLQAALHIDNEQVGRLQFLFVISYVVLSPAAGYLGDRFPRKYLIAAGVTIWSLATMASGLSETYGHLLVARAFIGAGEAGYATVAPGIISDLFSRGWRGKMMSVFYAAIPVGSALGFVVAGFVSHHWGWRYAFFVAGVPGLLFALAALAMKEPERGAADDAPTEPAPPFWDGVKRLFGSSEFHYINWGYTLLTFAIGGLAYWMPTFFSRTFSVPMHEADFVFGGITVVCGFLGTAAGGLAGDWAMKRHAGGYLWISAVGLLLGAPFAIGTAYAPGLVLGYGCAAAALFFLFFNTGPINAALVNCVPASLRALAVAANIACIHVFGDAFSPDIIGAIADRSSMRLAVALNAVPIVLGGLVLYVGSRRQGAQPAPVTSAG
jgi:MFS family permease